MITLKKEIDEGFSLCAKYAFMPNRLKYCGPNNEITLFDYARTETIDQGLVDILKKFETFNPYLKLIAKANNIKEPFNKKVVEAYWLGSSLLNKVSMNNLYQNLLDEHHLARRLKLNQWKEIIYKIPEGAKPHHSFQVLNVFINTGHRIKGALSTLNCCMITSGKVIGATTFKSDYLWVETKRLLLEGNKMVFKKRIKKKVRYKFNNQGFVENIKKGDLVSLHWDFVCEKISLNQAKRLDAWNQYHLNIANLSI